jgi:hypothetical protein
MRWKKASPIEIAYGVDSDFGGVESRLRSPDALLGIKGGEHHRFVVDFGGVAIDRGGRLGTQITVSNVEVESAHVMRTVGAGELHAALDARDGVEAVHGLSVVFCAQGGRNGSEAAKVTNWCFQKGRWIAFGGLRFAFPGNEGTGCQRSL